MENMYEKMDVIADSYFNGQFTQMKRQWIQLEQEYKERFINERLEVLLEGNNKAIKGILTVLLLWSIDNE